MVFCCVDTRLEVLFFWVLVMVLVLAWDCYVM